MCGVAGSDPGLKLESGYHVFDSGQKIDAWIQGRDGRPYSGHVWPGACVFPDYTMAKVREWWAGLYKPFLDESGIGTLIWNDMNEPAVFSDVSKTMPIDNIHRADAELGGTATHSKYHNVVGALMVRATRAGLEAARPNERPFVLSRAGFIGSHRYAATWSGDNQSTWAHLALTIPMVLNTGLSGQTFSGPDIGGFTGSEKLSRSDDAQLFARWLGIASLVPFARGHTMKDTLDREPYAFGGEAETICRAALQRRYQFIPYLYTLFERSHRTGSLICAPLFFADPTDPALRKIDSAFLLGDAVQVSCNVNQKLGPTPAYGASNIWFPFSLDDPKLPEKARAELPALYLRGGSIVATGPVTQSVNEKPSDPLTIWVALGKNGTASGELYEDSGNGHEHRTKNDFCSTRFSAAVVELSQVSLHDASSKIELKIQRGVDGGVRRPNHPTYIVRLLFRPSHLRQLLQSIGPGTGTGSTTTAAASADEPTVEYTTTVNGSDASSMILVHIFERDLIAAAKQSTKSTGLIASSLKTEAIAYEMNK